MGCGISKEIQKVATSSDSSPEWLIFFRSVVNSVSWVSNLLSWWYFMFVNSLKNIKSFNMFIALKQSSKFIDTRSSPSLGNVGVWVVSLILPSCKFFKVFIPDLATNKCILL